MTQTSQTQWRKYFDTDTVTRLVHLGLKPSGLVEGNLVGDHRSPFHGFAIEFAGHRGYVAGDDIRHLDWKAYYKTGKYLLKQYAQETNFFSHIVVDVSESMAFAHRHGSKLDYAAFMATALSRVIVEQSDSVGAFFFADALKASIPASRSEEVVEKIAGGLVAAEAKGPSAIGRNLGLVAEQIGRRRVVFVISDFFGSVEDTFDGIKRLLDDRHEVVMLQILDPLELDFDIPGRVRLLELEGAGRLDVVGVNVRDAFREYFHGFLGEIRRQALALGVDYLACDMRRPFGQHLAEYLSGRVFRRG